MVVKFEVLKIFRQDWFAVGIETTTCTYFLSIPVSNGLTDYNEYYRISRDWAEQADSHIEELRRFAEQCRHRLHDADLMLQPGSNRGTAV